MRVKRIIGVILCLIMASAMLPAAAFADESITTVVCVGGTDVSGGGYWLNDTDNPGGITKEGAGPASYNVHYATDTNTLTLNNANISKSGTYEEMPGSIITAAVYAIGPLTVELENNSSVLSAGGQQSTGIYCNGILTIDGGGCLTATGGTANALSSGVAGVSVNIKGGTVTAAGGGVEMGLSSGVFCGNLNISGGTVTATGGTAAIGYSYGVYGRSVIISGGAVTANGGEATGGKSYGLYGDTIVDISSGTVKADGGKAAVASYGICCSGVSADRYVNIKGGTVTAIGGEVTASRDIAEIASSGICCSGKDHASNIIITGGIVTATGGAVTATGGKKSSSASHGISCSGYSSAGNVTIKGGDVTATGGAVSANTAFNGNYGLSCGMNGVTVTIEEGSEVTATGGTVTASGGAEAFGQSYGVFGGGSTTISGGTVTAKGSMVTASGGAESRSSSFGVCGFNSAAITGGTVTASGSTAMASGGEVTIGQSFGVCGNSVTISGGTVLAVGQTRACAFELRLSGDPAACYITTSKSISGFPANLWVLSHDIDSSEFADCKYLRIASCAATISNVTVGGTTGTAIAEAEAAITLLNAEFRNLDADNDVSNWFTNLPAGLSAKIKTVSAENTSATITLSGTPAGASAEAMTVTVPADKLNKELPLAVTPNADAKWDVVAPPSGYIYTHSPVTVYNDPSTPNATVWLSGSGLDSSDMLVTERNPSGSEYKAMLKLAGDGDVFATYNIHLKSGKKSTDSGMNLAFKAGEGYAGQDFTLVHQRADSTYEYFYDTADANGDLSFGPLYELSPFMLVKGTLAQTAGSDVKIPATGDSAQPALWLAAASVMAAVSLAGAALCKRRRY